MKYISKLAFLRDIKGASSNINTKEKSQGEKDSISVAKDTIKPVSWRPKIRITKDQS